MGFFARASVVVAIMALAGCTTASRAQPATTYVGTPEDFMKISQLYSRYNYTIDNGDGPGWADNFTPDGVFQDPSWCAIGREKLIEVVGRDAKVGKDLDHFHFHSLGPITYIDRDHATVHSTVVVMRQAGFGKTGGVSVTGTYDDQLTRVNGEWKFAYRLVKRLSDKPPIACPPAK